MPDRVVPREDISDIRKNLNTLIPTIEGIGRKVDVVDDNFRKLQGDFSKLQEVIDDFIEKDFKAKQLQLAQTRVVAIRQEIDKKFGFYDELRRLTTGILQAADLSMVKRDAISNITDEVMLSAPKYWLAPVLVASSAWLLGNESLSRRAVTEALKRDDEKASLFFALLTRRAKRSQAYQIWLDRYFGMQDPEVLDRQSIVVINALVNGVFGIETYEKCLKRIQGWLNELGDKPGYVESQTQRWEDALRLKIKSEPSEDYSYLKKHSPSWNLLSEVLQEAQGHEIIFKYFQDAFTGEIKQSPKLEDEVDHILTSLSSKFDDEELPLIREERLQSLIIQHDGDKEQASKQFSLEQVAFEDKVSFTQILTNAAMTPELTETSRATQRFAIALSSEWISSAHQDFTAKNRKKVPKDIEIEIDDWKGSSQDGSDESQLVQDISHHYEKRKNIALAKVKIHFLVWLYLILGSLLISANLFSRERNNFLMLIGFGGGVTFGISKIKNQQTRAKINSDYEVFSKDSQNILRATLAEIVDWRREYDDHDSKENEVREFLDNINPEEYILKSKDSARRILAK